MDLFKLLDVSSPKIIRDTLNKTVTAFNILEEYVTDTANNALSNSEAARIAAEQSLQNANNAVDTANNAKEQSRSATEVATNALDTANMASANAATALEVSNRALLDSAQAVATSNTASANANNALEKATASVSVSDIANANASTALSNSTQAVDTANTAHQKAEEAIATANESKTESASAKGVANTAEANSISAINTATTAANTSATAEQNALAALETAQEALKHVIGSTGTQVSVNGEAVTNFNADVKADVTYVDQKVADLIGSAPDTLDTLAELSGALRDNKDIIKVLEDAISTKANASDIMAILATKANTSDVTDLLATKADTSALANYLPLAGGEVSGTLSVGTLTAATVATRGDVQAAYLQASAAGHETGTYDKIATLSNTGYIRYRTKAELKSDIGVPTDCVTSAALTSALASYLRNDVNGTIAVTGSDTPLNLKSTSSTVYLGFINSSGTPLGYIGVNSVGKPVFYDTKDNQLAFKSDIPANYLPLTAGADKPLTGSLYVRSGTNDMRVYVAGHGQGVRGASNGRLILGGGSESGATQTIALRPAGLDASGNEVTVSASALYPSAGTYGLGTSGNPWNSAYITTLNVTGTLYIS